MSLETEITALTEATNNLVAAVNVSKAVLDAKAAEATGAASTASTAATTASTQAGIATTGANTATTQASIATTKANEAALSAAQAAAGSFVAPVVANVNSTSPALLITQEGTGNALEVRDVAGDTTPFVVDASGNVGIGGLPLTQGLSIAAATSFGPQVILRSTPNDATAGFFLFEKGRSAAAVQSGDALGAIQFRGSDGSAQVDAARIRAEVDGTPGTNDMPGRLVFSTTADGASSPTERMRIDNAGLITARNSTGLGYGAGSGGTVTQATSKSTAVTLNKPSGQIVMHGEALAAGSIVSFGVTNSTIAANDVVVFGLALSGSVTENAYQVWGGTQAGSVVVYVQNISGGSLSEAVVLNFTVIKGSLS